MKKVGIITFHRAVNYGAVLQAYALQSTIDSLGGEAEIIDYRCKHLEDNYSSKKYLSATKSLHSFVAVLLKKCIPMQKKKRIFQDFIKQYLHLSQPYTHDTVHTCEKEYDLLITGSDQVWNYHHTDFDTTYFLNFVEEKRKIASYAASFGFEVLEPAQRDAYCHMLSDYRKIAVRENSGRRILKGLLGNDCNVQVTIDPVFLLASEQWMRRPIREKDYILVYELMPSDKLMQTAITLAKKYNKNIVRITGTSHRQRESFIKEVSSIHPEEFLGYVHDAEMVVTNSFHGSAFSIIYQKELYVVPLEGSMASLNTRMLDLLDQFKLQDRLCLNPTEVERKAMNWDACNAILTQKRQEAKEYLQQLLEDVE